MAGVLPTSANSTTNDQKSQANTDAINNIDMGTFLTLMIKELQNQDPLNPMDNKDMLAQISQIRSVGATDQLTKTLNSVLLGQNIASATNMIGADVSALTDTGDSVTGEVNKVTIDKGVPKLHIQNLPEAKPVSADGNIDAGTYGYKVVWNDDKGNLFGMDFTGDNAVATTGTQGVDRAIQLRSLPITDGTKYVYRTDKSGEGNYQLVGVVTDGSKSSFTDVTNDSDRNGTTLTQTYQSVSISPRVYDIDLSNVSEIRPPQY